MGRPKGGTKLLVEDSLAVDVRDLARAGVFSRSIGTSCSCTWNDAGVELLRINFCLEGAFGSGLFLRITGGRTAEGELISQRIQLATLQRPYAGNTFLFLCPGKQGNSHRGQRVRKLYCIEGRWLRRNCGNLTYLACRQHDSRKDHLLRNPDLLTAATIHDSDSSVSKPRPRLWRECNALCNSHRGRNLRLGRLSKEPPQPAEEVRFETLPIFSG